MDYKPYSIEWSRKRELKQALYSYLEDGDVSPIQVCEDIKDILEDWIGEYSRRTQKGQDLRNFFK